MNEIIKIKNNSFFSFVSIASRLIPNVLIFWMLARFFGPETFGKFSYSHTLANTFLLFADFGFDLLLTTEIAQNRSAAKQIFQQYFWIKIFLALASLLVMIAFVLIRGGDFDSILLGILFAFYMLFNTIANFFVASFKGFERLDYDAKVSLLMNLFLFFSALFLFLFHQNIFLIAAAYAISRIFGFVYSIKLAPNILPGLSYNFIIDNINENLKKAFTYGTLILSSSFLFQLDTILLGIYRTDYEVGIYQAVKNLLLVPFIVPGVVFSALLPTLARNYKENYDNWISLNKTFFKIVFWLNLSIAIILFAYPKEIIEIIYGRENYTSAIPLLELFSLILFLRSTSDYLGVMLITSGRQKIHIITSLVGILITAVTCSILIPRYGALGAGIVYLVVITFTSIAYLLVNLKIFFGHILTVRYYLLLFVSAAIALFAKTTSTINALIGIPFVIIIFVLFGLFFFFTENERKSILTLKLFPNFRKS